MMNALREHASGWVAKFFLLLLVLSFGAWGIGDIFTHAAHDVTLAEVGGTKISRAEFDQHYQGKVNELRNMLGSSFSPEILKSLNMEMQVLSNMVDEALVRKEAKTLGIIIGDSDIQDAIRKNPDFKGESGKFDLRTFQTVLQNNQISEKRYYDSLRIQMSAGLILNPVTSQKLFPGSLTDSMVRRNLESRTAEVLVIPASTSVSVPAPSEAELNAYYEENKNNFTAPEMREGKYIDIRYEDQMKTVTVSPEEITRVYRERIEDYRRPETRELSQLIYEDEETAQSAYALLQKNTPLAEVAKKIAPTNPGKISLGFVSKSDVPSNAANAVFELKAGEYTKPISSDFGWNIFQVKSIKPENVASLEEVQPAIEKELKQHSVEESVYGMVNKLEDALASGNTFEAAAKDFGLAVKTIPAITKQGEDTSGKKAEGLPAYSNFVSTLFSTDEKNQSPMTIADDGSYFVIETTKVTPERILALGEVKSEVTEGLTARQKEKLLAEKAYKLAEDINKGTSVSAAISASGLNVKKINTGSIMRTGVITDSTSKIAQPASLTQAIFALPEVGKSTQPLANDGGFSIGILKSIQPAAPEQVKNAVSERAEAEKTIAKEYGSELYDQYMRYLRDKYDVVIYQDRLPKASESSTANDQ